MPPSRPPQDADVGVLVQPPEVEGVGEVVDLGTRCPAELLRVEPPGPEGVGLPDVADGDLRRLDLGAGAEPGLTVARPTVLAGERLVARFDLKTERAAARRGLLYGTTGCRGSIWITFGTHSSLSTLPRFS